MSSQLSRKLRRTPTAPERAKWAILYPFRGQGIHFRRQVNIGTYFVDFACHDPALVIEVDGDTHSDPLQQSNDAVRDDYLAGRGYRVLRFWNNDVIENAEGVHSVLAAALTEISGQSAPPTPDPSPRGGGRHENRALQGESR